MNRFANRQSVLVTALHNRVPYSIQLRAMTEMKDLAEILPPSQVIRIHKLSLVFFSVTIVSLSEG
jgi:hypothetical protein